ncbi:MAG: TonB-dependent receptor [Bacteroidales bacterium]
MRVIFLVLGLCGSIILPGYAQNVKISGSVHDAESKVALPYSSIVLKTPADSAVAGSMTDEKGKFNLSVKKQEDLMLEASSIGYRKMKMPLDLSEGKKIDLEKLYLEPDTTVLNEVNVAAQNEVIQKFDRKIFGINDNKKAAAKDIYDLLRTLPGVVVDEQNNIRYKGSTPGIRVDDMPAQYLYPDIAMIPVDNVEKIELIDASMRSGGDGKGGIINIKLKKATSDGLSGVISGKTGTCELNEINHANGYVNMNYKIGDFLIFNNFWMYGRNNRTENRSEGNKLVGDIIYDTNGESFNRNAYMYMMNYIGTRWKISDKTKLMMAFGLNRSNWDYTSESESRMHLEDNLYQHYRINSESGNKRFGSRMYAYLQHNYDTTQRELTAYINYAPPSFQNQNTSGSEYEYLILGGDDVNMTSNTSTETTNRGNRMAAGMYYNHPITEKTRWNARYRGHYDRDYIDETKYFVDGQPVRSQYGNKTGYSTSQSLSLRFGTTLDKWKLDGGLEQEHKIYHHDYEHYTESLEDTTIKIRKNYYNLLPSATIQFTLDSLQDIKLSYSRSVRVPWSGYLSDFVVKRSPTSWRTGNPDLEPSAYNNVYLGYNFNKPMWNMSAELFYSQTDNEVSYMSYPVDEMLSISMPDNIAFQSKLGIDLSGYVSFDGKYSFSLSSSLYHSYIDATSLSESLEAQGVPVEEIVKRNYGFNAKLNSNIKIAENTSGMVYLNYHSRDISFKGYDYPSFSAMASISQHFFERQLMVSLSVRNLLTNLSKQGGYTDYAGVENTREIIFSTRHTPMYFLSVRYRFRKGDRNTSRIGQGLDS